MCRLLGLTCVTVDGRLFADERASLGRLRGTAEVDELTKPVNHCNHE